MAGHRGLDRGLGGLGVANFADHNDIRVMAQEGTKGAGKGHTDRRIGLGLGDAGDKIFGTKQTDI